MYKVSKIWKGKNLFLWISRKNFLLELFVHTFFIVYLYSSFSFRCFFLFLFAFLIIFYRIVFNSEPTLGHINEILVVGCSSRICKQIPGNTKFYSTHRDPLRKFESHYSVCGAHFIQESSRKWWETYLGCIKLYNELLYYSQIK